jgi:acetyltransferase, GNAT family
MAFCKARAANLRIDTHKDNAPMLHNIRKHGFAYCGVIHTDNGSERLAFQWLRTET